MSEKALSSTVSDSVCGGEKELQLKLPVEKSIGLAIW
jgi:hypothetical protein